jgi:hypothetical protein
MILCYIHSNDMYMGSYNSLHHLLATLNNNNSFQTLAKLQQQLSATMIFNNLIWAYNTFIYTKRLIEIFPPTTLVLSYQIKIFLLLRIYYNKYSRHTYKRKMLRICTASYYIKGKYNLHRSHVMVQILNI